MFIEYVNLAAVSWLIFHIWMTTSLINANIGRTVTGVNLTPLVLSTISLVTLGVEVIKDLVQ